MHHSVPLDKRPTAFAFNIHEVLCIDHRWLKWTCKGHNMKQILVCTFPRELWFKKRKLPIGVHTHAFINLILASGCTCTYVSHEGDPWAVTRFSHISHKVSLPVNCIVVRLIFCTANFCLGVSKAISIFQEPFCTIAFKGKLTICGRHQLVLAENLCHVI